MLKKNLEEAEGQIKSLTSGLDDVDARVKELSGQLNLYTQEAAVLEIKLNEARWAWRNYKAVDYDFKMF